MLKQCLIMMAKILGKTLFLEIKHVVMCISNLVFDVTLVILNKELMNAGLGFQHFQ